MFSWKFHIQTLGKKKRSVKNKLAKEVDRTRSRGIDQLSKCFEKLIPKHLLARNDSGRHSRSRIFTKANQKCWPQQSQQKPGCGFASLRVCACFSLKTGAALSYRVGNKKSHELRLFRDQWEDLFQEGDISLGDKMFSNYFDFAKLSQRGVDSVATQTAGNRKPPRLGGCLWVCGGAGDLVGWLPLSRVGFGLVAALGVDGGTQCGFR